MLEKYQQIAAELEERLKTAMYTQAFRYSVEVHESEAFGCSINIKGQHISDMLIESIDSILRENSLGWNINNSEYPLLILCCTFRNYIKP